jgi:hypothetical protein
VDTVVVLSDSLAICDERGPRKFNSPVLYPARLADRLERTTGRPWKALVFARFSWSVYWAGREMGHRPDIHRALSTASAVVVGLGGIDAVAIGTPRGIGVTSLKPTKSRFLRRNARLRRWANTMLDRSYSLVVRLLGQHFRHTPPKALERSLKVLVDAIRSASPNVPIVWILPPNARPAKFGGEIRFYSDTRRRIADMARGEGIRLVAAEEVVNTWEGPLPDAVHWPVGLHERMAATIYTALNDVVSEITSEGA